METYLKQSANPSRKRANHDPNRPQLWFNMLQMRQRNKGNGRIPEASKTCNRILSASSTIPWSTQRPATGLALTSGGTPWVASGRRPSCYRRQHARCGDLLGAPVDATLPPPSVRSRHTSRHGRDARAATRYNRTSGTKAPPGHPPPIQDPRNGFLSRAVLSAKSDQD
jgi:hypothetical protein